MAQQRRSAASTALSSSTPDSIRQARASLAPVPPYRALQILFDPVPYYGGYSARGCNSDRPGFGHSRFKGGSNH